MNNWDFIIYWRIIKTFRWASLHLMRALCKGQQDHHENTCALSACHATSANTAALPFLGITYCESQGICLLRAPIHSQHCLFLKQVKSKKFKKQDSLKRIMLKRPANTSEVYLALVWWCRLLLAASAATCYMFTEKIQAQALMVSRMDIQAGNRDCISRASYTG